MVVVDGGVVAVLLVDVLQWFYKTELAIRDVLLDVVSAFSCLTRLLLERGLTRVIT